MNKIEINDELIGIFTDTHFGKSKDSTIKLNVMIEYFDWFITKCKENNIKTVLHLGDLFNNRISISLKTLDTCYNCLKKFKENDIKLFICVGNHDMYMKEDEKINSINHFNEIQNITTIDKPTELFFSLMDKSGIILPFTHLENQISEHKNTYEYAFGHFEFNGAIKSCDNEISKHGLTFESISELAPTIFTGHYHVSKEYLTKNGKIISIGSTNEHDWGDYENEKRFCIFNTSNGSYSFIKNDFSPRHIKIFYSDLKLGNKKNLEKLHKNYVKLIVDAEYEFEKVVKVINFINNKKPIRSCEVEYLYNVNFDSNALNMKIDTESEEMKNYSQIDYMNKFIEQTPTEQIKDLDILVIKSIVKDYFDFASSRQLV